MKNNKITYKSATIGALLYITCIVVYMLNSSVGNKYTSIKELGDVDKLKASTSIVFDIPKYIEDKFTENTVYQNNSDLMLTIYDKDFALKIANFVDINADPLALYDESVIDNKYIVKNSDITYLRFRSGYKEFPNSILINWCTNETSYGLMIDENITENKVLDVLNIEECDLEKLADSDDIMNESDIEFQEYTLNNSITLNIPVVNTNIQSLEISGATTIFIDHELAIVIVYNDYDLMAGTYEDMSSIVREDGIKVYYNTENPFNPDSVAFRDYEVFIETIEDICKSIIYSKN